MEDVETMGSVGLDEDTRKQMALMGREGKGAGRKKVRKEGNDGTTDHPGPEELVADVKGLKETLSKLEKFTKHSEEVSFLYHFPLSSSSLPFSQKTKLKRNTTS